MPGPSPEADSAHWRRSRTLTITVLVIWAVAALGVQVFAEWLNEVTFLGFPLGYYMGVQGSLLIFVVLVFWQNWRQDWIDDEFGQDE